MDALEFTVDVPVRDFTVRVAATVRAGETLALAGPSGAGKSTVLRALAGLVRPRRGQIVLEGTTLFDGARRISLPPERRRIGLVFQDYALFPHKTVAGNVAYGASGPIDEHLDRVGIAHLADAYPQTLSGGERQRVAIARALAREPALLLLDEPLSALDAHTRTRVRAELRDLLAALRLPAIVVSHSWEDAVELADRVGVLVRGRLLQLGTPTELLAAPVDAFVARLAGRNAIPAPQLGIPQAGYAVVVAPWDVFLDPAPPAGRSIPTTVRSMVAHGDRVRVRTTHLVADVSPRRAAGLRVGATAWATFAATGARLVPDSAQEAQ